MNPVKKIEYHIGQITMFNDDDITAMHDFRLDGLSMHVLTVDSINTSILFRLQHAVTILNVVLCQYDHYIDLSDMVREDGV